MLSLHEVRNNEAHKAVDVVRHLIRNEVIGLSKSYVGEVEGVEDLQGSGTSSLVMQGAGVHYVDDGVHF